MLPTELWAPRVIEFPDMGKNSGNMFLKGYPLEAKTAPKN